MAADGLMAAHLSVLLVWGAITGMAARRALRTQTGQGSRLVYSVLALMGLAPVIGSLAWFSGFLAESAALQSATRIFSTHYWQPVAYLVSGLLVLGAFWKDVRTTLSRQDQLEDRLAQREAILARVTDAAFEGIYIVDPERMVYVDVNPAGSRALGYEVDDMQGMSLAEVHPDENFRELSLFIRRACSNVQRLKTTARLRNGQEVHCELVAHPVRYLGQTYVLVVGRDITRKLRAQARIKGLNRVYQVLSSVNRAITREETEDGLLSQVCRIAVEEGTFDAAWAGRLVDGTIRPEYQAGSASAYIGSLRIILDHPELGIGPVSEAVRQSRVVVVNDVSTDQRFRAWRDLALESDIHSVAAIPVMLRQQCWGVVVLYSHQPHAFDSDMVALLGSLGEDLSFALHHLQLSRESARAGQELEKLSQAVEQSADAVMMLGTDGVIQWVNARFEQLTGYGQHEAIGRLPTFLCATDQEARKYKSVLKGLLQGRSWKGEFRYRKKNGEVYWSMDTISPVRNESGTITHFVSSSEDYTDLRKAQELIEELAFYDPLTGLPNRRLLHDRMRQSIRMAREQGHSLAVLFLDLDKFKQINDSLGHAVGDELLKVIAQRLEKVVGKADTVARLGGDEFTVVISKVVDMSEVVLIAEEILSQVARPLNLAGSTIQISTSLGITLYPDDTDDVDALLRYADLAMYHAKSLGRNNFQFYTEEINARAMRQVALEQQLREAVLKEQFELFYQPKIALESGEIEGVEALIRWRNAAGQLVSPGEFIPLAEETGLIEDIGRWVLKKAITDLAFMHQALNRPIKMAINLSAAQLREGELLKLMLGDLVLACGVQPEWIELELTESMLVEDIDRTIAQLNALRDMGFSLAIDDFGTGYSSLSYLHRFPIHTLKIDRAFVQRLETEEGRSIVGAIVALARALGKRLVAEGVETPQQLAILRQYGVESYQGFHFSPPVPMEELLALTGSTVRVLPGQGRR
ncbi:EAL domain-containing protein [Hahella sp. SMD15-11]|uniref:EAL domain-containing protein n=1 Tax=Thermohahella caldifontis TaxID=3142973 RepID=A0AB39V061_9GAMM